MNHRLPAKADAEVLAEPVATRLLERASELDVARGTAVAELRAAAAEAGISAHAFDAALAELHSESGQATVPGASAQPRRRPRLWAVAAAGVAALIAASTIAVARVVPADASAAPMVEQSFLLRCLSPGEAAELARPLLRLRTNTVVYSPARAPRVLTIRATPEQIQNVRSLLDQYDDAGSPACASGLTR